MELLPQGSEILLFLTSFFGFLTWYSKNVLRSINLTRASAIAGVCFGDHAIYPDCRPEFYNALSTAFSIGNWDSERISFELPYIKGDKSTIRMGIRMINTEPQTGHGGNKIAFVHPSSSGGVLVELVEYV